jgi:D-tyrosyl-tRNA(Tyr) deacylase
MIALIQRVCSAQVRVDGQTISEIGPGLLLLLGIGHDDDQEDIEYIVRKTVHLRIFSDSQGNLNYSLLDTGGEILIVSQFTLLADTKKGRRPSFSGAAPPQTAEPLYRKTLEAFRRRGTQVSEGLFGAIMEVSLVNDGPVTIIIDSREQKPIVR